MYQTDKDGLCTELIARFMYQTDKDGLCTELIARYQTDKDVSILYKGWTVY